MSRFIRRTQRRKVSRSRGVAPSGTRWTTTPLRSSSDGSSPSPRVSTWTSTPCATRPSESLRTWRASPPSTMGGYSHESINTRGVTAAVEAIAAARCPHRPTTFVSKARPFSRPQGGRHEVRTAHLQPRRLGRRPERSRSRESVRGVLRHQGGPAGPRRRAAPRRRDGDDAARARQPDADHGRAVRRHQGGVRGLLHHGGLQPRRGPRDRRAHPRPPDGLRGGPPARGVPRRLIEQVFRDAWGRVLAALVGSLGDVDLAEEVAQEAFAVAAERWPRDGTPDHPVAWLVTTARHRAIDRLRRERSLAAKAHLLAAEAEETADDDPEEAAIPDERLELMFMCCHPALAREAQVALTLRALGGLTTEEIARA